MAASFQSFRSLIENSPEAISLIDTQGEILYESASITKILGYQPEDLVGRNCLDLIHPADRDHSSRAMRELLARPSGPLRWDARVRHKDGSYSWLENTVSNLLPESAVETIMVRQRDIDARGAAEAERRQHTEEPARANSRLEDFAYTVAHDLREPLRTISAFTELLAHRMQINGENEELAGFIVDGVARMSSLLDDLLSFASAGAKEPDQRVDLRHALTQAMQDVKFAIEASGAVVTVGQLPIVQSNEIHLMRLFQNLISNAVKYRAKDPVQIHISAERCGPDWVVRIEDNGLGIAPENHTRVFMPLVRLANKNVSGTGLGLAICKKIVEGFGGTIWVESELGEGSAFCFTIPALE